MEEEGEFGGVEDGWSVAEEESKKGERESQGLLMISPHKLGFKANAEEEN